MNIKYWKTTAALLGVSAGTLMIAALSASPAYAWGEQEGAGASQCADPAVDDAGTSIGTCEVNNVRQAFVKLFTARAGTFLTSLASTSGGAPCAATGINNAAAGSEIITGWCADANAVSQGVFWPSSNPTAPPTLLQPMSTLGLLPDVETMATAFDTQGVIVGDSINSTGTETPVFWSPAGVATALNPALLQSNANCVPADVNDATTPSIVGNCADAGMGGGNKAVLWVNRNSAYTVLPLPSGANYCMASEINLYGQILGDCTYGDDSHRAVQWQAGGTTVPTVLTMVGGTAVPHTFSADMNDSGWVASNYIASGASAGFKEACLWKPAGGNTNCVAITAPGGGSGPCIATGIGNNNKIIGNYETAVGTIHGWHAESGSTTAVDDSSPGGGPNMIVTSISKSGTYEAGAGEDTTDHTEDFAEPTQ
jgi:hypothetical protein